MGSHPTRLFQSKIPRAQTDMKSVEKVLQSYKDWGLLNVAYVRVNDRGKEEFCFSKYYIQPKRMQAKQSPLGWLTSQCLCEVMVGKALTEKNADG